MNTSSSAAHMYQRGNRMARKNQVGKSGEFLLRLFGSKMNGSSQRRQKASLDVISQILFQLDGWQLSRLCGSGVC